MTTHFPADQFAVVAQPKVAARGEYGRTFDLHPALYALTVGCFLAYLGIMAAAFMDGELAIPMAIFVLFVVAGFGTPALWAKIAPPPPGRPQSWDQFWRQGFECLTGHVTGPAATLQVLILPALILLWGVGVAIIAAAI